MRRERLQNIGTHIISSQHRQDEVNAAIILSDFFSGHALDQSPAFREKGILEFSTNSGIAISTKEAAHCTTDYLRTTRFIKGVYAAIEELIRRFPNERLRILYAGCGPYATLILPVLPFFSEKQLEVVLLDINPYSLDSARELIEELQVKNDHMNFIAADATVYEKKEGFHLIITETMFQALIREPQVAITEHLRKQLIPNGIFIPEDIQLDAVCTSFGKEPHLKGNADDSSFLKTSSFVIPKRLLLGTVFSISSRTNFETLTKSTFSQIESNDYKIPDEGINYPDVCIFTQLRIYGTIYLHSSESLITNPYCVASLANMTGYSQFKLIYEYHPVPAWTYQLKK